MIPGSERGRGMFDGDESRIHRMRGSLREHVRHRRTVGRNRAATVGEVSILICRFSPGQRVGFTTTVGAMSPDRAQAGENVVSPTVVGGGGQMGIRMGCESTDIHTQ